MTIDEKSIVDLINKNRKENSKKDLEIDPDLTRRAIQRAQVLKALKQWSHSNFKDSFKDYQGNGWYGENLAKDFNTSDDVDNAWMNSPTHKDNILKDKYTHVGVGVIDNYVVSLYAGKDGTPVVKPISKQPDFIDNRKPNLLMP